MNDQLEKFILLCEAAVFPHREELLRGLVSGEYTLETRSTSEVPSKQLLGIYDVRARHLRARLASGEVGGTHAERLLSDTENFVLELAKSSDETVGLWRVFASESTEYAVLEAVTAKRILGCLLVVSRIKVSEREWADLWGEEGKI